MAAVIAGNGLGLFDTRLTQWGVAKFGQGGDAAYVNIATGNLVLQGQDEQVTFRGLAIAQTRTYNAQGSGELWQTGFERSAYLLSGTVNAAGSVARRETGDGSYQDFTWSSSAGRYVSKSGGGADDTLSWDASTHAWTWAEGGTGIQEEYDGDNAGRLVRIHSVRSDTAEPIQWIVHYDPDNRISDITADDIAGSGDAMTFAYDAEGRLASVSTREAGVTRGQVTYGYDELGRLETVTTDLTPDDSSDNVAAGNLDGRLFVTTYNYIDDSLRLAGLVQSDGTTLSWTYDTQGRVLTAARGDETTTYAYGTGTTTVTDELNRAWTYAYDGAGQLASATSPAVDGLSDITSYTYNSGNLTQAKTMRGSTVVSQLDYQYDANSNMTWQWDAMGNAVQRSYDSSNLLVFETRYTGVDPDRTGSQLPAGSMTTNYIHDAQQRLRFVVDAAGEVTEYEYVAGGNGRGQQTATRRYAAAYAGIMDLASLDVWATAQAPSGSLTTYAYDLAGRLSQTIAYGSVDASGQGVLDASAALTRFTYDAQGLLRQQIVVRGSGRTPGGAAPAGSQVTDYAYDGMGRLLGVAQHASEASAANDATSVSTTYAYLDSAHAVATTQDNGSTRTRVYDAAGHVVSDSVAGTESGTGADRVTVYIYDDAGQLRATRDANGGLGYRFYDAEGRLAATVDSTGAVVAMTYDGAGRLLQTTAYANRVDTSAWLVAGTVTVADVAGIGIVTSTTTDRKTTNTYDAAGRLTKQVDGEGGITNYAYDGADQLVQLKRTDAAGTVATARTTRYFYDNAGHVVATLDGEGYLTETAYDGMGRATSTIRYANASPSAQWASGTLAQLRPATNAVNDQTTRLYYDARGNQVGVLDAEGYLTETVVDEAGNTRAQRRYGTRATWQAGDTLASLRSRAGSYLEARMGYDALGHLLTRTGQDGTVTRYAYDEAGRLVRTTTAYGVASEVREDYRRYNVFDELIGEISGEGAADASAMLGGKSLDDATLTQAQLDQVYTAYGTRHDYDVLGRRTGTTDAEGNKTWYFYNDLLGRQYTVRGVAEDATGATGALNSQAEVTETRLDAFGGVAQTIAYTGRIAIGTPGSRASAQSIVDTLSYVATIDSMRQMTYDRRGLATIVANWVSATGAYKTTYAYNGFGELSREVRASGTAVAETIDTNYDRRGLQTLRTEGVGLAETSTESRAYDAFGRLVSLQDGNLHITSYTYDRLGRQITQARIVQAHAETWATAYDAWDRVASQTDALQNTTTYAYDTANRKVTVTSPEGVAITTTLDRHGDTVSVSQALPDGTLAATTYAYDRDGQLTGTTDALGNTQANEYDKRGLLAAIEGADGRRVEFHYDAAGRVLSRVEDPEGLALTTSCAYDARGDLIKTIDATGRTAIQTWDTLGRLTKVVMGTDTVSYAYDGRDRQVSVTHGALKTLYTYDALGRRISEVAGAGTAPVNLTTLYAYDDNGNVVRRTAPDGAVTRYYYDEANRLVYTVDPLGTATRNWYDADGRMVATRTGGAPLATGSLADTTTIAQLDAMENWGGGPYQGEYRVYDTDGHARFVLSTAGSLQENVYDAAGRLVAVKRYAKAVTSLSTTALLAGTVTEATVAAAIVADAAHDEATYRVLDAGGQVRATIDALGHMRKFQVDATGRIVGDKTHMDPVDLATLRASLEAGTATLASVMATVTPDDAHDPVTYTVFDGAGRQRYTVDAMGAVVETVYDGAGRLAATHRYANAITVGSTLKAKLAAGDATAQADIAALLVVDDARDQRNYVLYNTAGQLAFTLDASNVAVRYTYASSGQMSSSRTEGRVLTVDATLRAKLDAGIASPTDIVDKASNSYDQAVYSVYDAAGRRRYAVTVLTSTSSVVTEFRYDAAGRVVASVEYGAILGSIPDTEAEVLAAIPAAGGDDPQMQRWTRYAYDADGRLRFTIDADGAVTEQRYDALGRVTEQRSYGQAIAGTVPATESAVAAAVAGIADVRITKMGYDAAGRVTKVTDALNHFESFTYDAVGNKLTHTDKLGNTWTYDYDAAGRQIRETSPQVLVATSTVGGTVTTATRAIVTLTAYDALGNVVGRTEDADGSAPRTTQYEYDNRGHQIRTTFPAAGRIDPATGQLVATAATDILVTYDALGRAVVQKDTLGNYSYKVYTARGDLAYEVDQEGYVTSYAYDAFGQQTSLKRYSNKIVATAMPGWTAGAPITLSQIQATGVLVASSTYDRTLTTTWDKRGNKLTIKQGSITYLTAAGTTTSTSPITTFTYDGFGQLVKESALLDASTGATADTWHYYDAMGHQVETVDAEGYLTAWQYDARGQIVAKMEFAEKIYTGDLTASEMPVSGSIGNATIGYNRGFIYTYDALGRTTSETATLHVQSTGGTTSASQSTTGYTYDAEDRLTVTTVNGVANSTVAYDALGHATSVTEASRQVLVSNWQALLAANSASTLASGEIYTAVAPVTSMQYDAFGNAVQVTRSGAGATSQVTTTAYDAQGRALVTRDAEGTAWYSAYDAADHLVDSWYTLSINGGSVTVHATASYDMIGRQVATATTRTPATGPVVTDASSAVRYDAFGGITSKAATAASLGSSTAAANYTYDRAGNLLTSNAATGKVYTYRYDLAGHELREERPWTDGTNAATAYYTNTVDKLGRVIAQRIPSWNTDAAATATVSYTLDRWGNVLRQVDPRGYVTEYAYNERNQVTRRTDPQVLVVDEDGSRHTQAPVSLWMYDALGRLIASRDANGHARTFEYDAAGELVRSVDATGAATRQGYDAFGRDVAAQDALGHLTFSNYDRLDRVVAQGDFTLNAAGTGRNQTTLQAYLLNQNGDRLQVTDGTGLWTKYDYDSRSLLVRSQTQAGVVHTYTYDAQGRKTRDLDGLGNSNTWTYDFYGKLTDHHDLGGADYNYVYDARSGLLTNSSSTLTETFTPPPGGRDPWDYEDPEVDDPIVLTSQLLDRDITYYANGKVRRINDGDIFYAYEYDAAGNRTREEIKTVDGRGMTVHTVTTTTYDSNNRIASVTTQDLITGDTALRLNYEYDAVGNRRHVYAENLVGADATATENQPPQAVGPLAGHSVAAGYADTWRMPASSVFVDPEGTPLIWKLTLADGSPAPSWITLQFDDATGDLVFTVTPDSAAFSGGTFDLVVTATDTPPFSADAKSASTGFTLEVVSATTQPPVVAHPIADQTANAIGGTWSYTIPSNTFSDPEGGPLTYQPSPDGMPQWMSFDPATGTFSGTPSTVGSWDITVVVKDNGLASVSDTFTVTTPNVAPRVVTPIADQTCTEDHAWSFAFPQGSFGDYNGQTLSYVAVAMPGWATFVPGTRTFSGTPTEPGTYTFTVTASDDSLTVSDTFTLTVTERVNQSPVLVTPIPDQTATAGSSWSYQVPAGTFSDPDGDPLHFSQPTGMPGWMGFNTTTGTFSGTPTTAGSWSITVTASDATLGASDTFVVTVANVAPVVQTPIPSQHAAASTPWSFPLPANTFYDANGDTLTYEAIWSETIRDPVTHEVEVVDHEIPDWMHIDPNTGTFTGTPPSDTVGEHYDLYVIAYDGHGYSAIDNFTLTIDAAPNQAPVVVTPIPDQTASATGASWSYTVPAGTFSDPEGTTLTYQQPTGMPSWMSFSTTTHKFTGTPSTIGSWDITVTVQDPSGATVADTFTVTTSNVAPVVASAIPNQTASPGQAWSYTIPAGAFVDYNGQSLIFPQPTGMPSWMSFNATSRTFSGTAPTTPGSWSITATASDGTLSASDTFTVTVANAAPLVQNPIPSQHAAASTPWNFTFAANTFYDANGDTLTYEAIWSETIRDPITHEVEVVDHEIPDWMHFDSDSRTFTGTPPAGEVGEHYDLYVVAYDGHGYSAIDNFTLTIDAAPNQAPVVVTPIPDQTASATGASWSYTVPAGTFSDPEGTTLTYQQPTGMPSWMSFSTTTHKFTGTPSTIGSWDITVTVQDPSGATVADTFTVTTSNVAPVVASAIPNQTASPGQAWSYTIPAGAFVDYNGQSLIFPQPTGMPSWMSFNATSRTFSGTAPTTPGSWSITATASDGTLSASDTFTVTVANAAPVVQNPVADQHAAALTPWNFTFASNTFSDANGDTLTYDATQTVRVRVYDEISGTYYFEFEEQPLPSWMSFNSSTRKFTGTPPSGEVGAVYKINLIAYDGHGYSAIDNFQVTVDAVPNQAPVVVTPIPDQTANATGSFWTYAFPSNTFSDPEGGTLTYTQSGKPSWMTFNAANRTFSGTPSAVGTWSITVTAQDPSGATVSDTFTVTTPNVAPFVVTSIPDKTAATGQAWTYTFPAFGDNNGQALTYTLAGAPSWMSFDAATRTLTGTPTGAATYTLTVTASDGSLTASDSFTLTVSATPPPNQAPVIANPLQDQTEWLDYYVGGTFVDPDGDTLTYTYTVSPSTTLITFDPVTMHFDGSPPGGKYGKTFTITLTASDGHGHSTSDSFTLDVTGYMEDPMGMSAGGNAGGMDLLQMMQAMQQVDPDPDDPPDDDPPPAPPPVEPTEQNLWFTYDAENRVQVVNGALSNGQIVVAADDGTSDVASYALQYDAAGNAVLRTTVEAVTDTQGATTQVTKLAQSTYTERGQLQTEYAAVKIGNATNVIARHAYDAAGREIELRQYYGPNSFKDWHIGKATTGDPEEYRSGEFSTVGWLSHDTQTTYDVDGRVSQVSELGRTGGNWGSGLVDENGNLNPGTEAQQSSDLSVLTALSNVLYSNSSGASGYDAAGRLKTYRYQHLTNVYSGTTAAYTHTYTTTYEARDTYLEKTVYGAPDPNNSSYLPTTTTSTYDPTGRRVAITENTPISGGDPITRLRYFSFDADGNIATRRDGTLDGSTFTETADSRQHFTYVNGQQLAAYGEDGHLDAATQLTAFDSSDMGAEPTLVLEGDTLQSIAQRVYGNPSLWYVLAAANAVSDEDLVAGTTLKAPQVKTTANDASTFKPYDPNSITGPTTPSLPYISAPPRQHCDGLMTVLMVAIAVIVTVYTAGAASAAFGATATGTGATAGLATTTVAGSAAAGGVAASGAAALAGGYGAAGIAGAAVGGFVGSAVSQEVGKAIGAVDHFSLRGAVASGLTAGVTAGIGAELGSMSQLIEDGQWGKVAASGALSSMGAYTANRIAGIDVSFSWRSVAADALSAVVAGKINKKLGTVFQPGISNGIARDTLGGMVGGIVSLQAHRALGDDRDVDYGQIAADAFGNALGNAFVYGTSPRPAAPPPSGSAGVSPFSVPEAQADTGMQSFLGRNPYATASLSPGAGVVGYDNGDHPRSTAIDVSPLRPSSYDDPSITTLSTVVVTGDPVQDGWFLSMWDWSNQYHMAPPPTDGSRASLVQYRNQMTQQLAPAYDKFIRRSYAGNTVSSGQAQDFGTLWANQSTNKVLATGLGIVAGVGKTALDLVEGVVSLAGDVVGTEQYLLSGGMVGREHFKSLSGMATGLEQLAINPAYAAQVVAGAVEGWYQNTMDALDRGDRFGYGMQIGQAAATLGTLIDGPVALGRGLAADAAEVGQVGRLSGTPSGWEATAADIGGINFSALPAGISFDGTVYRLETPSRVSTTFDAHAGNTASNHRYSGPGIASVYGATSPETAFAEVDYYGQTAGRVSVSQDVNLENVLDLTDPAVQQQLNITLEKIAGDSYFYTHQLGDFARNNSYDGVLAPSARNPGGSNLVIFPRKKP